MIIPSSPCYSQKIAQQARNKPAALRSQRLNGVIAGSAPVLLEQHCQCKIPDGYQAVVRNGNLHECIIQPGIGDGEIKRGDFLLLRPLLLNWQIYAGLDGEKRRVTLPFNSNMPCRWIFMTALISRSCSAPQAGHAQLR
ncbi:hypothetical protein LZT28_22410 [Aeromonas media]|uniref:Uncharacterized protein n=1 Tax=Aeromonas media TaxID=651 RepID=A0AAW5RUI1_AERME|nr:hypothetical protein [Aeromonas media]MCV3290933.1 hypothetical protein [Aeromonas media]